jgi:hypothetical protein
MSGGATDALKSGILGHTLGFAALPMPAPLWVGLSITAPSGTVPGVEVGGGGYARLGARFALVAGRADMAANATTIAWPAAAAAWGNVGWFELWDAVTGGTRRYFGQLLDTTTGLPLVIAVAGGDSVRFSAGALAVQVADA